MPSDEADAQALWAAEGRRQLYRASEEGRHMAAALLGALCQLLPGRLFDVTGRGLIWYLSGAGACDAIGIKRLRSGGHAAFMAYMRVARLFVREEQRHPHFLNVSARYQRELLQGLVRRDPANFTIPVRLGNEWSLDLPPRQLEAEDTRDERADVAIDQALVARDKRQFVAQGNPHYDEIVPSSRPPVNGAAEEQCAPTWVGPAFGAQALWTCSSLTKLALTRLPGVGGQ